MKTRKGKGQGLLGGIIEEGSKVKREIKSEVDDVDAGGMDDKNVIGSQSSPH